MNMNWVIKAGISVGALMAMAACSSSTNTGAGGGTTTTTETGTTDTGSTTTDTTSSGPTCASLLTSDLSGWSSTVASKNSDAQALYDCACTSGATHPCALVCNDSAHPSFCAGTAPTAGGMCATCITMTTGANGCADQYNACKSN
jgi:hypothetical protein